MRPRFKKGQMFELKHEALYLGEPVAKGTKLKLKYDDGTNSLSFTNQGATLVFHIHHVRPICND